MFFCFSVPAALRRMSVWVALSFFSLSGIEISAANSIVSPDGNIIVTVNVSSGNPVYSVVYRGGTMVETSPLGLIDNNTNLGTGVALAGFSTYSTNETFASRSGIHATATNCYQGQIITLTNAAGTAYGVNFRVYNNGVAFRYEFTNAGLNNITAESSSFVIPAGGTVWADTNTSVYEKYYVPKDISAGTTNLGFGPPVTVQLAGTNGYLVLTESTLGAFGNPYILKVADATGRKLQVGYPVNADGSSGASVTGAVSTPWNVVMIGADLDMIMNNDMVESLAPAPDATLFPEGAATSWATEGRSVWDWLRPWPGGITYTNAMTNSLWASRMGFEYNTVDDGWSSWTNASGVVNPWPLVQQVVNYSHALGVKVILWKASSELNSEAQRAAFFQQLQACGVDGFKADFFDFSSASAAAKERVQLQETILREAASSHLVADFHGTSKPTGQFRTYPNLINFEAVFGKEQWPNPWMVVTIPFLRFMAGPADFTPMEFGGNAAFEIANVINMPGPLITFAERSDGIAESEFASLIRTIPSQWDQTLVLNQSQLGQTTATARRKGPDWYIGIMNAVATNQWSIPLAFLASNITYQADLVRQDSTVLERTNVTRDSVFSVSITSTNGSGFVAKIYPVPAFTLSTNYLLTGAIIGTSGSWGNSGNTKSNVYDGSLTTYFDGPDGSGDWTGMDLGSGNLKIVTVIRYCPRANWGTRMVTGMFQGANAADFSDAVTLYTVGYTPPEGSFVTVTITNNTVFRYVRYLSPASGFCNVAEVQFYGAATPDGPTSLTAASGLSQVVLNWNPVANATSYNVKRSLISGGPYTTVATGITNLNDTDVGLINGTNYYYVVSAVAVGVESTNSSEASAMPLGPPQPPTGTIAMAGTNQTVALTWNATFKATRYYVKQSITSGGPYVTVGNPAATNYTDSGLVNGTLYYYVISAVSPYGESTNSSEVAARPGGYEAWVRGLNPQGYWRLNETSGTYAADASLNGLDGIYHSAVVLGVSGVANPAYFGFETNNRAAFFNGQTNSWVSLPGLNLNSATVTFIAWIYPTNATQAGATGLIYCRDGAGTTSGLGFNPAGTQLGYTWNDDGGTYGWNSGLTPPANQWSFVVLVVTPTSATIYLYNTNGQLSAHVAHTHAASAFDGETRIGNDAYDASRTFRGSLCEIAVYNQALSSNQIATLYQAAVGLFYNLTLAGIWNGTQLTLTWPGGGQLLEATNLAGPWSTNFDAVSPSVVTPAGTAKFFRIQVW